MPQTSYVHLEVPVVVDSKLDDQVIVLPTNVNKAVQGFPLSQPDFRISSDPSNDLILEEQLTSYGGILSLKAKSAVFNRISYRLLKSEQKLVLSPLVVNNSLKLNIKKLTFVLPQQASKYCISISEITEGTGGIVVDILTTKNVLISMKLNYTAFLRDDQSLLPTNIYQWCKYSIPYSFDLRKPFFFRSIDATTTIVSLCDGGLLKLARSSVFENFLAIPFSDSSYLKTFKFSFFGSKKENATENVLLNNEKVSTSATLDFTATNNLLITLTLDKKVKFWSLESNSMINEVSLNEYLPQELRDLYLNKLPSDLISLVGNEYISLFLPIGSNYLKIFQIGQDHSLNQFYDLQPPLSNANWSLQDYKVRYTNEKFAIWISWGHNASSFIQYGEVSDSETIWSRAVNDGKIPENKSSDFVKAVSAISNTEQLNDYCLDFLCDPFNFNIITLKSATDLFASRYNLNLGSLSIRQKILAVITHNIDNFDLLSTLKKQWVKFDNACRELSKELNRTVSFELNEEEGSDEFLIVMKTLEYSVVKKASPFELLIYNTEPVSPKLLLVDVDLNDLHMLVHFILSFKSKFPYESLLGIEQRLDNGLNGDESHYKELITSIFESQISKFIDNSAASELLTTLNSIPDSMRLIDFLTELPTYDAIGYNPIKNVEFGELGESLLISSLRSDISLQKEIIFGLLLIVLTVDVNEATINLFAKLNKLLRTYSLSLKVLRIDPASEKPGIRHSENLFSGYLKEIFEGGALIRNNNLNYLINYSLEKLSNKEFVYGAVSKLLSLEILSKASDFLRYLPYDSPITKLLKGITLLETEGSAEEAFKLFMDSERQITGYAKNIKYAEKRSLEPISGVANLILTDSRVDYFYDLSTLFQSKNLDELALKLALKSLSTKTELNDTSDDQVILSKIFNLALKLKEFELAHDTILKMDRKYKSHPIKQFVYKLFQMNQIPKILKFPFEEDFDKVDELIYGLGESSALNSDLKNALKYYRVCYTLRLKQGDFRSSVESLYRFNCIGMELHKVNQFEDVSLLLDNYLIILNLLNTLDEDDRWLIREPTNLIKTSSSDDEIMKVDSAGDDAQNKLVTYADLEREYELLRGEV